MRQLVINGPHQWPGASFIQMEDGQLISLVRLCLRLLWRFCVSLRESS